MRKEYTMTKEQYDKIVKACTPAPLILLQCGMPPSVQETANAAWVELGKELGFDGMTAKPSNKDKFTFTAEEVINDNNKK